MLAEQHHPDIIITDTQLSGIDGMECIRQIKHTGLTCKFIVVSELQSFDIAYKAIKTGTKDFLLKPIEIDEFISTFRKLTNEIQAGGIDNRQAHTRAIRRLFLLKIIPESKMLLPLSDINNLYLTHFHEGVFRSAFIMLDFYESQLMQTLVNEKSHLLSESFCSALRPYCYDSICEQQHNGNGFFCLINYAEENDEAVKAAFLPLCDRFRQILGSIKNLRISICVSDKHYRISESDIAYNEVDSLCWSCRINDINSVIYYEASPPLPSKYRHALETACAKIKNSCEALDIGDFEKYTREFFSTPKSVLSQPEVKYLLLDIIDYFFSVNTDLINAQMYNSILLRGELIKSLMCCDSYFSFCTVFISKLSGIMHQLVESISLQKIRTVRRSIQYVKSNYQKPLSLGIVAAELNLSPGYFSAIFKKKTGQNFTDFVNEYRVSVAKEYLKDSNASVTEICELVGYVDQCYFSKIFKKYTGISPKEYRHIFDKISPVE